MSAMTHQKEAEELIAKIIKASDYPWGDRAYDRCISVLRVKEIIRQHFKEQDHA